MLRVDWEIKDLSAMESGHGVYFLRSNVRTLSERVTWEYYNLIREIECTNRQLKMISTSVLSIIRKMSEATHTFSSVY